MYLDVRAAPERLAFHDFVCAAQDVMLDRGINRSVWIDALQVMSENDAMICALITDARCRTRAPVSSAPAATCAAWSAPASAAS